MHAKLTKEWKRDSGIMIMNVITFARFYFVFGCLFRFSFLLFFSLGARWAVGLRYDNRTRDIHISIKRATYRPIARGWNASSVEIFSHELRESHRGTHVRDIEHQLQHLNPSRMSGLTECQVSDDARYVYNHRAAIHARDKPDFAHRW